MKLHEHGIYYWHDPRFVINVRTAIGNLKICLQWSEENKIQSLVQNFNLHYNSRVNSYQNAIYGTRSFFN